MNNYELTIILRVSDALESLKAAVMDILQKYGVVIQSEDEWGMRKLAYLIDKESEAYYKFLNISLSPDSVQKIIKDFRLNTNILRYLFVKKIEKPKKSE